jgi:hypothetical protein
MEFASEVVVKGGEKKKKASSSPGSTPVNVLPGASTPGAHHNLLLSEISTSTKLGREVLDKIEADGYVVLPSVLTPEECDKEVSRLWGFVEGTVPSISRSRPETWYPSPGQNIADPWPHSGWKFLPDMCQSYQSGWLFSHLREILAKRVFEPLYGTRELHSSKEGFTFHRPTCPPREGLVHPLVGQPRPRVCGKPSHTNGEHFDQRAAHTGLHCIQSSTALIGQTEKDGCFLCWPGSHKAHPLLTKGIWRARSDWVPLTDEELVRLRELGYAPKRVPVNKGDVILWRSDLCHCGARPTGSTENFRAVSYTCMLPAKLTPPDVFLNKVAEYFQGLSGDHRPNVKMCHLSQPKRNKKHRRKGGGAGRDGDEGDDKDEPVHVRNEYYGEDGLPELTWRQAELYGLVPYSEHAWATTPPQGVKVLEC